MDAWIQITHVFVTRDELTRCEMLLNDFVRYHFTGYSTPCGAASPSYNQNGLPFRAR
jgi:hypothetical protein